MNEKLNELLQLHHLSEDDLIELIDRLGAIICAALGAGITINTIATSARFGIAQELYRRESMEGRK